jgi:hypothetical protein
MWGGLGETDALGLTRGGVIGTRLQFWGKPSRIKLTLVDFRIQLQEQIRKDFM